MALMGLDIGTTGCKAIIFDVEGGILSQAYCEYPLLHPQPEWQELDAEVVWQATCQVIQEAVSKNSGPPVKALSVSAQGEAVTPLSSRGEILDHSIVTFDPRTISLAQWWDRMLGKEKIFEITGMPLHGMYTINKIMWWRENRPQIFNKAWKFLCYEDFIFYKMGLPPTIDYSLAARTMAFNIQQKKWSSRILEMAGISEDQLAVVKPSGEIVGEIGYRQAKSLGLSPGVLAVTGGHDQPAGALGAGIIREGIAMDATGTVECIAPAFRHPVLNPKMLSGNFCCYPHVVKDMYVTLAFNFTGGSLLRWYRDTLSDEEQEEACRQKKDVYQVIIENASSNPTSIFVLPHFTTTGTPWLDIHSKGAILGLTLNNRKSEIIRALLEGITYEMKLNLQALQNAGINVEEIKAIGGGAKSSFWLQLKADMWNKKVISLNVSEAACLGVAILAGVAAGLYSSVPEAVERLVKVKNTYFPHGEINKLYEKKFEIYQKIYPTLSSLNRIL